MKTWTFVLGTMAIVAVWLALASPAGAALIAADSFETLTAGDPLHDAAGGTGWFGYWTVAAPRQSEVTVVSQTLDYQAGDISISGGAQAMRYVATENGITDALAARRAKGVGDTFFMSFLYQTQAVPDGTEPQAPFIQIGMNGSATTPAFSVADLHGAIVDAGQTEPRPRNFVLRSASNENYTGVPSPDGQTNLLVLKAGKSAASATYDQFELFINPTSTIEANNTSFVENADSGIDLSADAYWVLRKAFMQPGNTLLIDEIKIGDTFSDVVADYEPADYIALTTAQGNGADAYIHYYSNLAYPSNWNTGGQSMMELKNAGSDPYLYRKAYLRFDLGDLGDEDVAEAAFQWTGAGSVSSASQTFAIYGLHDGDAGENWVEGTGANIDVTADADPTNDDWLTWNNAPANAANNDIDTSRATLLGTFDGADPNEIAEFTGEALRDFLNADTDGLVTLVVTCETHNANFSNPAFQFLSKEGNALHAPTLRLVMVPEPSTIVMLVVLAGWGGLWFRRRHG